LDHIFVAKRATCLVNPRAGYELELNYKPTDQPKKLAVVGAGPAGLSFATVAAQRGHKVSLFDRADQIGGQFNLAKKIPGKEEFYETIRYFGSQLKKHGVNLRLGTSVTPDLISKEGFDEVILATGIKPRSPSIPGINHPKVISYLDLISGKVTAGKKVAVIGAGGIGFDVCEFLCSSDGHSESHSSSKDIQKFLEEWGIDPKNEARSGIESIKPHFPPSPREITLLQRKNQKFGGSLGKTTGWIHRTDLKKKGVQMIAGVEYKKIDDQGLHIQQGEGENGKVQILNVDHIVICAGQDPLKELEEPLKNAGKTVHLIGGADLAVELDAKRAIAQGARLAASL
jgi:2,4-dienoyl-CoA reductase (NADPH2)